MRRGEQTQPSNHSAGQPVSKSVISNSSIHSINQSGSQSPIHSLNQSVTQPLTPSISQSISQSISRSVSQSVTRPSISQSISQSISRSVSQSVTRPLTQSVRQPFSQPVLGTLSWVYCPGAFVHGDNVRYHLRDLRLQIVSLSKRTVRNIACSNELNWPLLC